MIPSTKQLDTKTNPKSLLYALDGTVGQLRYTIRNALEVKDRYNAEER